MNRLLSLRKKHPISVDALCAMVKEAASDGDGGVRPVLIMVDVDRVEIVELAEHDLEVVQTHGFRQIQRLGAAAALERERDLIEAETSARRIFAKVRETLDLTEAEVNVINLLSLQRQDSKTP